MLLKKKNSDFNSRIMFQPHFESLEKFLWTLRPCSRYLKSPLGIIPCVTKKNYERKTHQLDSMAGKVKKGRVSKKLELQNEVGIFWSNTHFWAEKLFQKPLETFLRTLRECWRYLKGLTILGYTSVNNYERAERKSKTMDRNVEKIYKNKLPYEEL